MLAQLEEIKPIEVGGDKFLITVLFVSFAEVREKLKMGKSTLLKDYYTGYAYLEHLKEKMEFKGGETYRKDKVIGVDTTHSYNENMTTEEKKKDVYRQLTTVIEEYLEIIKDIRKLVGAWG